MVSECETLSSIVAVLYLRIFMRAAGKTVVKIDLPQVDASIARKGFCVEDVRHVEDEDKV